MVAVGSEERLTDHSPRGVVDRRGGCGVDRGVVDRRGGCGVDRGAVDRRGGCGVDGQGHPGAGVAEAGLRRLHIDAFDDQCRGVETPQIVEACTGAAGVGRGGLPDARRQFE
jgi:hypothetical protein